MSKKGKIITGLVAFIVIIGGYVYLGGLNNIDYTIETVSDYNLVGVHFLGDGDSPEIEEAYVEAREYVLSGELDGVLTLVHYNDSTLEDEQLKLFIGVTLASGTSDLPANYQRLTIPATNAARAKIEGHNSIMPSPSTIESRLRETAEKARLELQDFTIEQYISENLLVIDMPVK
ncbi:MAG: GyrI-like domain-containing protein [Roseivirga sp.]|uniref:GyrI-like domain-containing protein n=1 Tax=Roseivirga sp. TaxID=1964215 RepID=UPI001B02821B|nr:GyrI-like domain-containing protein [Roseivirga sp.]MBO6497059.1 GyrI-like domain-containing protein [Roseivirga sp.]